MTIETFVNNEFLIIPFYEKLPVVWNQKIWACLVSNKRKDATEK